MILPTPDEMRAALEGAALSENGDDEASALRSYIEDWLERATHNTACTPDDLCAKCLATIADAGPYQATVARNLRDNAAERATHRGE